MMQRQRSVVMDPSSESAPPSYYRLFPSVRLCMFILLMLGATMLGGGLVAFNFSIVCMVNESAILAPPPPPAVGEYTKIENGTLIISGLGASGGQANDGECSSGGSDDGSGTSSSSSSGGYNGQFSWDKATQSNLLAAHSYGALVSNIPGGLVADRFGVKILLTASLALNAIAAGLTPQAAYAGATWVFVVRFAQGLAYGVSWPATMAMASFWGTAREMATLTTLSAVGFQLGFFVAMSTSSVICDSSPGWFLTFYLWAGLSVLFIIAWLLLYTDQPERCRFISSRELRYIQSANMRKNNKNNQDEDDGKCRNLRSIPWSRILFSPCILVIYVCQFSSSWATYYISVFMPTYSKEVLHFDVRSNGFASALPSLCHCVGRFVFGPVADRVTFGGRSKTFSIKLFTMLGTLTPAAFFVVLGLVDCRHTMLAVAAFTVACTFLASSTAGYIRAGVLIAPRYSGLIGSLYSACGFLAAIVMPYAVGAMTSHGTVREWKNTAFLTVAVLIVSCLLFMMCGTAELQKWGGGKREQQRPKQHQGKVYVIDVAREPPVAA